MLWLSLSHFSSRGVQKVHIQRSTPFRKTTSHYTTCCTEHRKIRQRVHILEQKCFRIWLSCSGSFFFFMWTHQKNNNYVANDKNPLRVFFWVFFFPQSNWITSWERVLYSLRVWPSARGPWAVVDSSTKHAGWYFSSQLGKLPRRPVQRALSWFHPIWRD